GESNKSTDLITRINRAKPQPIGRPDVPASFERALLRAMSRRPEQRQGSVLELVRELQAVETELGVPQTPIEVARDDWALATVGDLEDRTRIRSVAGTTASVAQRRRRRRGESDDGYSAVGTVLRDSKAPRSTGASAGVAPRRMTGWLWAAIAGGALALALAATALVVLLTSTAGGIPTVSDIRARVVDDTVTFTWNDPGLQGGDVYAVQPDDGSPAVQQREPSFTVDSEPGARVCVTVAVVRDGKTGPAGGQKCADIP
ncbi:MAG TPA: serine/threonine protein kinase, partial [Rhodoglobus sp.]|nr:serine/threonine protein kinase [Rhodoglobus sp.]